MIVLIRRRLDRLAWASIKGGVFAAVGAASVMALGLLGWLALTAGRSDLVVGLGGVALGGGLYYVAARLLGAPEAEQLPKMILPGSRIR